MLKQRIQGGNATVRDTQHHILSYISCVATATVAINIDTVDIDIYTIMQLR